MTVATVEFTCRRCGDSWSAEKKRGQTPYWCDECRPIVRRERTRADSRRYRERHKESVRERKRASYASDTRRYKGYQLKTRYGVSIDEYEELLTRQGGGCALCGVQECQTGRFMPVDHCHTTGRVRGVLCNQCNATLLPGYEALPKCLQDSAHINAYLAGVIENDPLLIGAN